MTGLLDRLGDRVNPIVVKETRQAVNSRLVSVALLVFLAVQFVAVALLVTGREFSRNPDDLNLRAGREVFVFVQGILLGTCMLLIPALTGGRLAAERSDVRVDLLFISALSPRAIVAGKFAAAAALALLIFSACAPFMTFAYVLRGLDVPTIGVILIADFLAVLVGTMFAVLLAAIPANRAFRVIFGIGGFGTLCYVFAGALAVTTELLRHGAGADMARWEFWAGFAGLAALALGAIGLMFVWATALITPPTANRALPVRAYTFAFWAVTGIGCGVWANQVGHPGPVFAWGFLGTALAVLQFLVAISERDSWGPRVARRIPRSRWLRVPAFFFYSGAAGGLAYAVGGGVLSVAGMWAWYEWFPPAMTIPRPREPVLIAGLILGYTYCYCMSAVVVRRLDTGSALPIGYTWLVTLILFGIGCAAPFVAAYALYDRHHTYSYLDDKIWLFLSNPVVMFEYALHRSNPQAELTILFLTGWAAVITVINGRWFLRQVERFHPPAAPVPAPAPTVPARVLEPTA